MKTRSYCINYLLVRKYKYKIVNLYYKYINMKVIFWLLIVLANSSKQIKDFNLGIWGSKPP